MFVRTEGTDKYRSEKLVTSFLTRYKYAIHASNLAQYLNMGMELLVVHRVLKFRQSKFLKQYIDYCTDKRAKSTTDFRKRLFKNFSNCCFGKFIESARKRLDSKIVNNRKDFEKWTSSPRFSNFKVLSEGLVAIFLRKLTVTMRQSWGIGFTILERSKGLIYDHYYNKICPALDFKCLVIFTDTDSLCILVYNGMVKEEIFKLLRHIMDFSNYDKNHPMYNSSRRNRLGFWKDELKGSDLEAFCGLASKTYAMKIETDHSSIMESKCKGTVRGYRKCIPFSEYKKCITGISSHCTDQYTIQSKNHTIYTIKSSRLCFSSFDSKRYIYTCGIHSVPYGSVLNKNDLCDICK